MNRHDLSKAIGKLIGFSSWMYDSKMQRWTWKRCSGQLIRIYNNGQFVVRPKDGPDERYEMLASHLI